MVKLVLRSTYRLNDVSPASHPNSGGYRLAVALGAVKRADARGWEERIGALMPERERRHAADGRLCRILSVLRAELAALPNEDPEGALLESFAEDDMLFRDSLHG